MSTRELTKEEMAEYLKVENFLKKYKGEIDFFLSIGSTKFDRYGKYSAIYNNARDAVKHQEEEKINDLSMIIACITAILSFLIFNKDLIIAIAITCLVCLLSIPITSSKIVKDSISDYRNVTKRFSDFNDACCEARIFYTKDYIVDSLSPSDKDLYVRIDKFFSRLIKYGYYDKYLSPEEKAKKENSEQEKIKAYEKLNEAKEPIEKEYWESRIKALEEELKKFQR